MNDPDQPDKRDSQINQINQKSVSLSATSPSMDQKSIIMTYEDATRTSHYEYNLLETCKKKDAPV